MRKKTGLERVFAAFRNSNTGFIFLLKNEAAFRQELAILLLLLPLAFFWADSTSESILLVMSLFIVLIVEILNTAIEVTVDRIGREHDYLSGLAKDLGSAAVLASLLMAFFIWGVIGWKNIT